MSLCSFLLSLFFWMFSSSLWYLLIFSLIICEFSSFSSDEEASESSPFWYESSTDYLEEKIFLFFFACFFEILLWESLRFFCFWSGFYSSDYDYYTITFFLCPFVSFTAVLFTPWDGLDFTDWSFDFTLFESSDEVSSLPSDGYFFFLEAFSVCCCFWIWRTFLSFLADFSFFSSIISLLSSY